MIRLVWMLSLMAVAGLALAADRVLVGNFAAGSLAGWHSKSFKGETRYRFQTDAGRTALHAVSAASASGLYYEHRIDLTRTPVLHWSWKVDNVLRDVDEHRKSGDDYAARVYVIVSGGLLFWNTRTLVYVWSNNQPVGSHWANPFTDHARHIAVESGPAKTGRWLAEQRNVRRDWQQVFGTAIDHLDAVAIMTDTDNSGQRASAWYGDIWFGAD